MVDTHGGGPATALDRVMDEDAPNVFGQPRLGCGNPVLHELRGRVGIGLPSLKTTVSVMRLRGRGLARHCRALPRRRDLAPSIGGRHGLGNPSDGRQEHG